MSLDSTTIGTIGAIAGPVAALINPVAGLAVSSAFSLATSGAAADEQRELTQRNINIQMDAQRANEERQRRENRMVAGRFRQRIASSGFTTRGSPIERLADLVAEQELGIQTDRFQARQTAEDISIRGEFAARQTQAQGIAAFAAGVGRAGQTLLGRIEVEDLLT